MDTDELDQWLDADRDDPGDGRRSDPWDDPSRTHRAPSGGRPRWLWPAVAAVVLWLGVMLVALGGGEDAPEGDDASAETAADLLGLGEMTAEDPTATGAAAPTAADGSPSGPTAPAAPGDAMSEAAAPGMGAPPGPGVTGAGAVGSDAPVTATTALHGAAVAALRGSLTTTGAVDSYLEHATPVATTPLAEGAAVVVVDAIWLEGPSGQLSDVHRGRWAVPLAADATLLGRPWPVGAVVDGAAVPEDPPVGALRLEEVAAAMTDAGWQAVHPVAAEPHPFLAGVVVALVTGAPPGDPATATATADGPDPAPDGADPAGTDPAGGEEGSAEAGTIVWLQDVAGELALLGAAR